MDLFVEKEFIFDFEAELNPEKKSNIQNLIYNLFKEYSDVHLYTDAELEFVEESELLWSITDHNPDPTFELDFEDYFSNDYEPKTQTLVFTENSEKWFNTLKNKGVLCFSYDSYEKDITNFLKLTHFKIDLSDENNLPIDWEVFKHIKLSRIIIISDPYILSDRIEQKIEGNLLKLLETNLSKGRDYKLFIITQVDKGKVEKHLQLINRKLAAYSIKVFLINRNKRIESIALHDRLLYTNYSITESGIGFNLNICKPNNSQLTSESIFEKHTYKRFKNHINKLKIYVTKLEQDVHLEDPYKVNTIKAFIEFNKI